MFLGEEIELVEVLRDGAGFKANLKQRYTFDLSIGHLNSVKTNSPDQNTLSVEPPKSEH